jgi:separase
MDFSRFKQIKHCPSAFLWGCSSGQLRRSGVHDPYGGAVAYLLSGASFVVGNLWDVTDGDIDKLSMNCMGSLFHCDVTPDASTSSRKKTVKSTSLLHENDWSEPSKTPESDLSLSAPCDGAIAKAIVNARSVCKLRRAVGFAPVMYGIPVSINVPTK